MKMYFDSLVSNLGDFTTEETETVNSGEDESEPRKRVTIASSRPVEDEDERQNATIEEDGVEGDDGDEVLMVQDDDLNMETDEQGEGEEEAETIGEGLRNEENLELRFLPLMEVSQELTFICCSYFDLSSP